MPTSRISKLNVIITMGDPSGIGPEVTLKALASSKVSGLADFFVVGDAGVMERAGRDLGLRLKATLLDISNVDMKSFSYGRLRADYGRASVQYIDKALEVIKAGRADALVTAPINKEAVRLSGKRGFQGHTEYLAEKTRARKSVMMFVGKSLKVTLVTRHIALANISRSLSQEAVYDTIVITHQYLKRYFGIKEPRVGVAGLNPHSGEGGLFGREEERIIIPAIKRAGRRIRKVYGPIPPDVAFHDCLTGRIDCVVAMYHDQGLIPFKMLYFMNGVNLTLGLDFIRTSPDHGTAYDIAGKGACNPSSMIEAVRLACRLACSQKAV